MSTPKRERKRLAKAELLMCLAVLCETWRKGCTDEDPSHYLPFAEWADDDTFVALARTYQLTGADLGKLLWQIGGELENRAIRAGYDDYWDES